MMKGFILFIVIVCEVLLIGHNIDFKISSGIIDNKILIDKNIKDFIDLFFVKNISGALLFTGDIRDSYFKLDIKVQLPDKIKIHNISIKVKNKKMVLDTLLNIWLSRNSKNGFDRIENGYVVKCPVLFGQRYRYNTVFNDGDNKLVLHTEKFNPYMQLYDSDNYINITMDTMILNYIDLVEKKNKIDILLSKEYIQTIRIDNVSSDANSIKFIVQFIMKSGTLFNSDDVVDDLQFTLHLIKREIRKKKLQMRFSSIERKNNKFVSNVVVTNYTKIVK